MLGKQINRDEDRRGFGGPLEFHEFQKNPPAALPHPHPLPSDSGLHSLAKQYQSTSSHRMETCSKSTSAAILPLATEILIMPRILEESP